MKTREEISQMALYLKPYKYRNVSCGGVIKFDGLDTSYAEELIFDSGFSNEYPNVDLEYMQQIVYEIIAIDQELEQHHVGYITGYLIYMDYLNSSFVYGSEVDSFIEFDGESQATLELWEVLKKNAFGNLVDGCYLIDSIFITNDFYYLEVETTAINLIKSAFFEIYREVVNTIIYSVGVYSIGLFEEPLVEEDYTTYNDINFKRHIKNLISIGFEKYIDRESKLTWLYKDISGDMETDLF